MEYPHNLEQIVDNLEPRATIVEPREDFDRAIIGEIDGFVVYSYDRLVDVCEGDYEWVDFNIACLPNLLIINETIGEHDEIQETKQNKKYQPSDGVPKGDSQQH